MAEIDELLSFDETNAWVNGARPLEQHVRELLLLSDWPCVTIRDSQGSHGQGSHK